MAQSAATQQYVVLPPRGLRARGDGATAGVLSFLRSAQRGSYEVVGPGGGTMGFRVVDSVGDDGAKLIEATPQEALALRSAQPSVRVVPLVYYSPAVAPRRRMWAPVPTLAREPRSTKPITVRIVSAFDGGPVAGALVLAFTDVGAGNGAQAVTDSEGTALLDLGAASAPVERLYVYPTSNFWTMRREGVTLTDGAVVTLRPLELAYTDSLRHFYRSAPGDAGGGATVGVVDTGVAEHPDLVVDGGVNTVLGEEPDDFGDNGHGHGTHVAGIITALGSPPTGVRGVAPGARLRSYRVFGRRQQQASSFAIAKAVDQAVRDGCDLVNLSLGGGVADPVISAAVADARSAGSLCIAAAGNNGRGPVSFPAADELAVAVSALGRIGTFPVDAAALDEITRPFGTEEADFIGAFSNIGPQIDLTAPGVAVISTYPGGYAELSGTSMATPAVTGVAARLLAGSPETLAAERDAARSEAILALLLASARDRGFPDPLEGHGLPQPC